MVDDDNRPKSSAQALEMVKQKRAQGLRCVGKAESMSWLLRAKPGTAILRLDALMFPEVPDPVPVVAPDSNLAPRPCKQNSDRLVWVAAGATIDAVLRHLAPRRTLETLGAYSGQTFIGACATGTHGSGFSFGTLADLVEAVEIVVVDPHSQEIVRKVVQSGNGYLVDTPMDDELLGALVVGLGMPGVITAVLIRVVPNFDMQRETSVSMTFPELRAKWLEDLDESGRPKKFVSEAGADWHNTGILISPYQLQGDRHVARCVVSRARITQAKPHGAPPPSAQPCAPVISIFAALLAEQSWFNRTQSIRNILGGLTKKTEYGNAEQMMTNAGGFGGIPGYGVEYAFPVRPDGRWRDALKSIVNGIHNAYPTAPMSGFVSVRFQGRSRAPLARRDGPTMTVEVLAAAKFDSPRPLLCRVEEIALEWGGQPHWGQVFAVDGNMQLDRDRLAEIAKKFAPELKRFRAALHGFADVTPFLNEATKELWDQGAP